VKPAHPKSVAHIDNLAFDHVSFQHLTAKGKALSNISFGVKLGETIAFVGPSGSGKTTLVKLLVGLYPPLAGEIRSTTASPVMKSTSMSCASKSASSLRTPSYSPAPSAKTCAS
jgi:ABC-type transport system involved in cytochrome bd biosynthesis fused ATPase/permease subunit